MLLVSACRGDLFSGPDELPLEGPTWTLNHVDRSGDVTEPDDDETYFLLFDTLGVLRGRSDCNDCNGTYHIRKTDTLVLSLGCTEAACGPSGSSLGHFPVFASGVFDYRIDDSRLTLRKKQAVGTLSLVFDER